MKAVLAFLAILLLTSGIDAQDGLRSSLEQQYRAVSTAIIAKDLDAIVAIGYRSFSASSDEVRNIWNANFNSVAEYGPVEFRLEDVIDTGDGVVAIVDRSIYFRFEGNSTQHFEHGRSRDRWMRSDGQWTFVDQAELRAPTNGQVVPNTQPTSPRLRQLQKEVARGDSDAVASFWTEVAGRCPLVEPIADEPSERLVTFLWRHVDATEQVEVRGGPYDSSREHFERLPSTDIWYHSERLPIDSRYVYSLIVRRRVARATIGGETPEHVLVETYPLDGLNPLVFNAGSVLELSDAPLDTWHIAREGVAKGRIERRTIESKVLGEARAVRVYVSSSQRGPSVPATLAIFLDGEDSENLLSLPAVLDNLVAEGHIPPLVALFVDSQGTRGRDLVFHDPFIDFLSDELVPWASHHLSAKFEPSRTVISGMSLGGLTSAYAAYRRPDVFGNVLSQSGSYWRRRPDRSTLPEGWFPGEVAKGAPPKVRFYLEVGRFEAPGMVENNRRMRDVLIAKGCDVKYSEYHGGHDHVNWRVSVGGGLIALLGERQ